MDRDNHSTKSWLLGVCAKYNISKVKASLLLDVCGGSRTALLKLLERKTSLKYGDLVGSSREDKEFELIKDESQTVILHVDRDGQME